MRILLLVCLVFAGCTCAPPHLHTTRTRLTKVPPDFDASAFVMSQDGTSYAFVVRAADGFHVVHDGNKGPPYAEVTDLRMAPMTKQVAYWGVDDFAGKRVSLVVGETRLITALDHPGQLVFSASGGHWAAIGGTATRQADTVERGPVVLYRDGREVGSYPDATIPALSRDGQQLAILVENAAGQIVLVIDGREERTFATPKVNASPLIRSTPIGPSLAGMRVDYLADNSLLCLTRDESGWALYRDAARIGSFKVNVNRAQGLLQLGEGLQYAHAVAADVIGFAETTPVAAWWERLEGERSRWRVVRNGSPVDNTLCEKAWEQDPPSLSTDGTHVAYVCPQLSPQGVEEVWVVFDGRRFGPYAGVWGVTLSPSGQRVAYAADDDATPRPWRYVVDGVPRPLRYDRVWPPRFSPDERLLYWVAQRGRRVVLMVNGSGRASSDTVAWVPRMTANSNLWWITQRGRRLSRVEVTRE